MTAHSKAQLGTRQLASGDWRNLCPDCGTISIAPTLDELDAMRCGCPPAPRRMRFIVELQCAHCARTIGGVVIAHLRAPVLVPRNLRCRWCNGPPQPGEVLEQVIYATLPRMVPRLGRPPE